MGKTMSNSFVRLLGLMLIGAMMAACGGGSGEGRNGEDGKGSEGGGITSVSITADNNKTIMGETYRLTWTISGTGSCTVSGGMEETVIADGSAEISTNSLGDQKTTIDCGSISASVTVNILPEYISIPDDVFADALTRVGYEVIGGLMHASHALSIEKLCITGFYGAYGEPDSNSTVIFENSSVPDNGVRCAYTPEGKYITDTTGLEYFLNLKTMRLEFQQVESIDISTLQKLFFVSFWDNPLRDLDLSNNTAIVHLGLSETSLTSIDTSNLPNLVEAAFQHSTSSELPYTTPTGNVVYGFSSLDFSKNQKLERVYLIGNPLIDLGISNNQNSLRELWASGTQVEVLDLAAFQHLNYIILSDSKNLRYLNTYGVNNNTVPYRFYCENCPRLSEIVVYSASAYEAARGRDGIHLDEHIMFVDGP